MKSANKRPFSKPTFYLTKCVQYLQVEKAQRRYLTMSPHILSVTDIGAGNFNHQVQRDCTSVECI